MTVRKLISIPSFPLDPLPNWGEGFKADLALTHNSTFMGTPDPDEIKKLKENMDAFVQQMKDCERDRPEKDRIVENWVKKHQKGGMAGLASITKEKKPKKIPAYVITWLYLHDDLRDKSERSLTKVKEWYSTYKTHFDLQKDPHDDALIVGFKEILSLMSTYTEDLPLLQEEMEWYFRANILEKMVMLQYLWLPPSAYDVLRNYASASRLCFIINAIVDDLKLTLASDNPLLDQGGLIVAWDNDIYSGPKEVTEGSPLNGVFVQAVDQLKQSNAKDREILAPQYSFEKVLCSLTHDSFKTLNMGELIKNFEETPINENRKFFTEEFFKRFYTLPNKKTGQEFRILINTALNTLIRKRNANAIEFEKKRLDPQITPGLHRISAHWVYGSLEWHRHTNPRYHKL